MGVHSVPIPSVRGIPNIRIFCMGIQYFGGYGIFLLRIRNTEVSVMGIRYTSGRHGKWMILFE